MPNPIDQVFSAIHRRWLKPLGFRKSGRKCIWAVSAHVVIEVAIESYPALPGGAYRFSLQIKSSWRDPSTAVHAYVYLPSYATREQFWIVLDESSSQRVGDEVSSLFQAVALPSIRKMQTLEGLAEIFESTPDHVSLHWYYTSYLAVLNCLGRHEAARTLLQRVMDTVEKEDVREQARALLVQQEASGAG